MATTSVPIVQVFKEYSTLFRMRNLQGGELDPKLEKEWQQVVFTLDAGENAQISQQAELTGSVIQSDKCSAFMTL